jgi:spore coat polysaccharide biosynthesis protein SpsF (cytidylyltransferase family)
MTRAVAIIQARLSSTRLPGKVLQPLLGMPLIVFMWRRVLRAKRVDDIVLATSLDPSDDPLAAEALRHGLACHRGDLNDVLARFEGAARATRADVVVRLTGDCPLIDPDVIDRVVDALVGGGLDYVSNCDPPTYPDGLDVEAFTLAALSKAHACARLPSEREHVTPYIRNGKALFAQANVESAVDMSALRWTVDHAEDLAVVRGLVAEFSETAAIAADRFDFLRVLDRKPELAGLNQRARNEGYAKSLQLDAVAHPTGDTS